MLPPDRLRALLRELDDPENLELPDPYDIPAALRRFARLIDALEHRFGPSVTAGAVQDASYLGEVAVPAPAGGADRPLWVLMSNFGPFVTAGTGRDRGVPGCERGLDDTFVTWLDELCAQLGCRYVPVALLLEPYDGPSPLTDEEIPETGTPGEEGAESGAESPPPVWWDRYFQFM